MTGEETLDDRRTEEDGGDEGGEQEEDAPTEGGVILCTSYQVPNDDVLVSSWAKGKCWCRFTNQGMT